MLQTSHLFTVLIQNIIYSLPLNCMSILDAIFLSFLKSGSCSDFIDWHVKLLTELKVDKKDFMFSLQEQLKHWMLATMKRSPHVLPSLTLYFLFHSLCRSLCSNCSRKITPFLFLPQVGGCFSFKCVWYLQLHSLTHFVCVWQFLIFEVGQSWECRRHLKWSFLCFVLPWHLFSLCPGETDKIADAKVKCKALCVCVCVCLIYMAHVMYYL